MVKDDNSVAQHAGATRHSAAQGKHMVWHLSRLQSGPPRFLVHRIGAAEISLSVCEWLCFCAWPRGAPSIWKGGLELRRAGWLLRVELPSDPELLCVVRSAVMRLAEQLGFPSGECTALTRAVDEALANIICHAYNGRPGQPIDLTCRRTQARASGRERAGLEIVLTDRGAAVDRKKLCGRSLDDVRPGGLGLHFIQGGVDFMQYRRQAGRNQLRLVKYLPPAKPEPRFAKGN